MSPPTLAIAAAEDVLARLLAAPGLSVIAVIPVPATAAARRHVRATVALAAERRAPAVRINAILTGAGATEQAVAEAAAFLSGAVATTGQTLDVG